MKMLSLSSLLFLLCGTPISAYYNPAYGGYGNNGGNNYNYNNNGNNARNYGTYNDYYNNNKNNDDGSGNNNGYNNNYNNNGYSNNNNYNNNGNSNGYNNQNNYNNGNSNSGTDYSNNGYSGSNQQIALKVCDDSVVRVTSVSILCTSPYTFYYGNGAHRNSNVCDYLDKAMVKVSFRVIADIEEESDFYMTMALRDQEGRVLAVTDPSFLCNDYVGSSCTDAGHYSFQTKLRLETPSDTSASEKNFVPKIQMAFSTKPNHGYNLGALNTECKAWDNDQPGYVSWSTHSRPGGYRLFLQRNGALLGTCVMLFGIIAFVWSQSAHDSALFHLDNDVYAKEDSNQMPLVA